MGGGDDHCQADRPLPRIGGGGQIRPGGYANRWEHAAHKPETPQRDWRHHGPQIALTSPQMLRGGSAMPPPLNSGTIPRVLIGSCKYGEDLYVDTERE